jgi:peptidyl-prolyl cis-trans isomerase-like protein 2
VTGKAFTPHSHIVALKTTGDVYSYDAIEELNVKPKNWKVCAWAEWRAS